MSLQLRSRDGSEYLIQHDSEAIINTWHKAITQGIQELVSRVPGTSRLGEGWLAGSSMTPVEKCVPVGMAAPLSPPCRWMGTQPRGVAPAGTAENRAARVHVGRTSAWVES